MHFNWLDLFKAPRLAISTGKRLIIQTTGLLAGYAGYLILTYLAWLFAGQSVGQTWDNFGLFPVWGFGFDSWISALFWWLGIAFFLFTSLWFSTAVAKVTYEELKGDQFYSAKESLSFIKGRFSSVISSPLTLFFLFAFLVIVGALIGLVGRIPAFGELFFALIFGIPVFVVAVFGVLVGLVFFSSLILTPAVVGTLKSDTFTTVLEYFQTVWNQPGRFFGYAGINLIFAKVGIFVMGYFFMRAFEMIHWACGSTMGDKLDRIFDAAWGYLPPGEITGFFTTLYPGSSIGYGFPFSLGATDLGFTGTLAAFLMGITLVAVFFLLLGYGLTVFTCGQTIGYIITYKHRENENLLDRKNEEEPAPFKEVEGRIKEKTEPQRRVVE